MSNLSDSERKAYEEYILSQTDEQKQEAIKKLIPGSNLYYHLYFLDRFKQVGSKLSEQDLKTLDQFCQKYPHDQYLEKIQFRHLLLKYDDAQTDEQKGQIISELQSKYLSLRFDHTKPEDFAHGQSDSMSSQDENQNFNYDDDEEMVTQNVNPFQATNINFQNSANAFQNVGIGFSLGQASQPDQAKKQNQYDYERFFSKENVLKELKPLENDQNQSTAKLSQLPYGYEHSIDFTWYHPTSVYLFACSGGNQLISDIQNESFFTQLGKYFLQEYTKNTFFQIDQNLLDKLTLIQLDKLNSLHSNVREDKNFVGSYFNKMFHEELSQESQEIWTLDEKRSNLERLFQYAKSKNMPKGLQSSLLLEILEIGVKLGIYEENYFKDYLTMPLSNQPQVFKGSKSVYGDTHWNKYIGNVQSQEQRSGSWQKPQNDLISKYLEYFCEKNGNLETFKEEFEAAYLKLIEEKISIYKSDDMTNLNVDLKKYQQISQEVILRFLEANKEIFKVDETVTLKIELKNIQTLYVKIFEFNTETYYKKTLQPFNTSVNIDGLVASQELKFEYKYPSNKKSIETLTLEQISSKPGLYIVELIGNGMSARAVIKKGSLTMIHKPTIAGHLAYVLDENKKICTGPKTGIQLDGEYFEAQSGKNGKIFIPYGKAISNSKAILMNNGFAQLTEFQRLSEQYSFTALIFLNSESILIGNSASIVVRPSLQVNNRQASLDLLKNTKITLTTNSYIDNIPVTQTFENVKFNNNKELVIDFQVPPYLNNISVNIDTEVINVTLQTNQSFNGSKTFNIQTHANDLNMTELFLRKEQGSYCIYLLGKNGEPRPKQTIFVTVGNLKFFSLYQNQQATQQVLVTDKEGKVKLGHLKNCIAIQAQNKQTGTSQTWALTTNKEEFTYPKEIDSIENEVLEFPVLLDKLSKKKISFLRLNKNNVLEDLYNTIELVKLEDSIYNKIRITNLSMGEYQLKLKSQYSTIKINVHNGQYWENDSFVLKKGCLFENQAQLKMIKIQNVKIEENKQGTADINVKLEDFTSNTRVHILANQFQEVNIRNLFYLMKRGFSRNLTKTVFPFASWKNIFLSNRELGDEYRYVFDRKYAQRMTGNSLERPKVVLKRHFIQTTQIDAEVVGQGTSYENVQEQYYPPQQQMIQQQPIQQNSFQPYMQQQQQIQPRMYTQNIAPSSYNQFSNMAPPSYDLDYAGNFNECDSSMGSGISPEAILEMLETQQEEKILEYQNFLKQSPLQLYNLIPNENGEISFTSNLSAYTQITIIAIDNNSVAQKTVDLTVNSIVKRDLTLLKSLDSEKGFTESRNTIQLKKQEKHFIEDITSTEIQIIDDLKKVKAILLELMKTRGTGIKTIEDLGFVLNWFTFNEEEKSKQYSKYQCHELNIFIFNKDQEFFQKVVKNYLDHKMEKTIVDYYLLGQYDKAIEDFNIINFQKINALELCFIIDVLVKTDQKQKAQRLVEYLRMQADICDQKNVNELNRIFDIVLNLNSQEQKNLIQGAGSIPIFTDQMQDLLGGAGLGGGAFFGGGGGMNGANIFAQLASPQQAAPFGGASAFAAAARPHPNARQAFARNRMVAQTNTNNNNNNNNNANNDLFMMDDMCENIAYPTSSTLGQVRKNAKIKFEELEQTSEYQETHYYQQKEYSQTYNLIRYSSFWADYGEYLLNRGNVAGSQSDFLSANFTRNALFDKAAFLSLALLDLPFEASKHEFKTNEGRGLDIQAANNLILFKKEVKETELDIKNDIMVTHRYISVSQQHTTTQTESIPDEFLTNSAYLCEVIMTNVSPQQKEFSILYQIPQGSLPLQQTKYMKSIQQSLSPYTTNKMTFYFYFPKQGNFTHFPSNISIEQKVVAKATMNTLKVVDQKTSFKKESFIDIVQSGSKEDILEFLRTKNLIKGENNFSSSSEKDTSISMKYGLTQSITKEKKTKLENTQNKTEELFLILFNTILSLNCLNRQVLILILSIQTISQ